MTPMKTGGTEPIIITNYYNYFLIGIKIWELQQNYTWSLHPLQNFTYTKFFAKGKFNGMKVLQLW